MNWASGFLIIHNFFLDVSTSACKDYEIEYPCNSGEYSTADGIEAAAHLTRDQNLLDIFLEKVPEDMETRTMENAALSITNLLNPTGRWDFGHTYLFNQTFWLIT